MWIASTWSPVPQGPQSDWKARGMDKPQQCNMASGEPAAGRGPCLSRRQGRENMRLPELYRQPRFATTCSCSDFCKTLLTKRLACDQAAAERRACCLTLQPIGRTRTQKGQTSGTSEERQCHLQGPQEDNNTHTHRSFRRFIHARDST